MKNLMKNRSITVAILDCIAACMFLLAGVASALFGYRYAMLSNKCRRLEKIVEEVSAEKALLEGFINSNSNGRLDTEKQGWIPPVTFEN